MIDAILYIPDFPALVQHLNANAPEYLKRDDSGELVMPPVVVGFDRTPAVMRDVAMLVYVRMGEEQADEWRGTPGVEVLAESLFTGPGTGERVYQQIWDDDDALAKYESVHPRVRQYEDEDGNKFDVKQDKFGVIAGA